MSTSMIDIFRKHLLPHVIKNDGGKEAACCTLVNAVKFGQLTLKEAKALASEFDLK